MLLYVACGGAIGASARHLMMVQIARIYGNDFPYSTIAVNIIGSLLMGVLIETLARTNMSMNSDIRALVAVGILGGFTTFSTFSLDFFKLFETGQILSALIYAVASVILSLVAIFAGVYLIKIML
jgi:CrcB protein